MARGELIRKLFSSHKRGSQEEFRAVALEIVADEQRKNNNQLARDLLKILDNGNNGSAFPKVADNLGVLPKDRERQTLLVDVRQPDRSFGDILLKQESRLQLDRVIEEYRKSEILRTHGLMPKTKLLFCGPPGCGKTLCAEVLAAELGLPLLYTRFDAIVSSFLGETAANLRKVFDFAASARWVVLFDEFDAIGKARDDASEHGEIKRVINSFLQLLDSFQSSSLLIAATNHEHMLDPALWRRFDEILFFSEPTLHEIRSLLAMKLKNFPHPGVDTKAYAQRLKGMSHADIERICLDAIKISILENEPELDIKTFEDTIKRQKARLQITSRARGNTHE